MCACACVQRGSVAVWQRDDYTSSTNANAAACLPRLPARRAPGPLGRRSTAVRARQKTWGQMTRCWTWTTVAAGPLPVAARASRTAAGSGRRWTAVRRGRRLPLPQLLLLSWRRRRGRSRRSRRPRLGQRGAGSRGQGAAGRGAGTAGGRAEGRTGEGCGRVRVDGAHAGVSVPTASLCVGLLRATCNLRARPLGL